MNPRTSGYWGAVPTSITCPTPARVLRLAEGLLTIGFPPDVERAVASLRRFTAHDPTVLEAALALARQQSRVRRSKLLVVELLIQSLIGENPSDVPPADRHELAAVGAD
jgi:hypothetical protein